MAPWKVWGCEFDPFEAQWILKYSAHWSEDWKTLWEKGLGDTRGLLANARWQWCGVYTVQILHIVITQHIKTSPAAVSEERPSREKETFTVSLMLDVSSLIGINYETILFWPL